MHEPGVIKKTSRRARIRGLAAALLGALAGSMLARAPADACSCAANDTWDLNLKSSNEPDDTLWPKGAVLQTHSWGPILLRSYDWIDAKIDFIRGEL